MNEVLVWVVLVQAVVIAALSASVLPLWWCYATTRAEQRRLEELPTKVDQLDEVVSRLCEAAGVPQGEVRK